jgi:hypothetical protein
MVERCNAAQLLSSSLSFAATGVALSRELRWSRTASDERTHGAGPPLDLLAIVQSS